MTTAHCIRFWTTRKINNHNIIHVIQGRLRVNDVPQGGDKGVDAVSFDFHCYFLLSFCFSLIVHGMVESHFSGNNSNTFMDKAVSGQNKQDPMLDASKIEAD
jgi:hypothetical protein